MAVDYDLVVIGSSWEGIYAAKNAAKLQARVALVTQTEPTKDNKDSVFLPDDLLFNYSLATLGKFQNLLADNYLSYEADSFARFSLAKADTWILDRKTAVQSLNSLSDLAALGVDVVVGKGQFSAAPNLALQVKRRKLTARRFLLATGTNFIPDFIDRKTSKNYLTLRDIPQEKLSSLPTNIIIIGGDPAAIELAQHLSLFHKKITLVVRETRLLFREDRDLSSLMQGQLEAAGIDILVDTHISQIKTIQGRKCIQAGDRTLWADEVIVVDYRQPNIAGLNLAEVNVKCDRRRVCVNQKLETTNPKIYACGDLIGGYSLPNIAQYEANIVLKNALFFPCYEAKYHTLPWAILTSISLARVGLNERQARQKYPKIYVVREYFNNIVKAKILDYNPGMFKLIVTQKGKILGCSIFGDRAAELITIPALMMQHNIKLDRNPMRGLTSLSIPHIYPSMAEIVERASDSFYQQKIRENPKLLNRLRSWFALRKG